MSESSRKPRKSDRTKAAILVVARRQFAMLGYEATTLRAIAEEAGIDPALIVRYFGGKDALFALTADIDFSDIPAVDDPSLSVGERAVRHFLNLWEGGDQPGALPVLLRSAASNAMAAERLRAFFAGRVAEMMARLAGAPVSPKAAGLIASQMLGFAYCRYILALDPVTDLSHNEAVRQLGRTIDRYLEPG